MDRRMMALVACAGLLWFNPRPAIAQTVAELVQQSEAQQRAAITAVVNTSVSNLMAKTDSSGKPKSAQEYEQHRAIASLEKAFFTQDPRHPEEDPPGFKSILLRIKKGAKENPNQTLIDVMGGLVDWGFNKFYTSSLSAKAKAIWASKSDADLVALFRVSIQMHQNERLYQRTLKEFEEEEARLGNKMREMEQNTVVLPDGRSVFRDKNGDLWAVVSGSRSKDTKLQGKEKQLAERLIACKARRGIKNGHEALAACRAEVGIP